MLQSKSHIIGGNLKVVRNVNRSTIINIIREKQPISRVKIAELTGLNKSTVSSVVKELLDEGLIYEEEEPNNNVGRNPINLRLKPGKHFVGAINIDSSKSRVAIVDIYGTIAASSILVTEADDAEQFTRLCVQELLQLRDQLGIKHLNGIGVSVAGIVDPVTAQVIISPNLGWEDFSIGKIIKKLCPDEGIISVDNDSNCSALAELWFGKYDVKTANFVFLSVGPGIGTGIVVDKKLMRGEFHASGEFGHMTLYEGGELCSCGNYGCWEAYASDRATVKRYLMRKRLKRDRAAQMMIQDIIELAQANEPEAIHVLQETGRFLGLGIANIIKALDPRAIIIGGRIIQVWDMIYPEMIQVINQRSFFGKKRDVQILPTSLSVRPRLLGAATLSIKELFDGYKIIV